MNKYKLIFTFFLISAVQITLATDIEKYTKTSETKITVNQVKTLLVNAGTCDIANTHTENAGGYLYEYTVTQIGDGEKSISLDPPLFTAIKLAESITNINAFAFKGFTNAESITISTLTPPILGENAFEGVPTGIPVYVPENCGATYRSSAWGTIFTNIIEIGASQTQQIENNKYSVFGRRIVFEQETTATVYSITGSMVYSGVCTEFTVPQKGIYILKIDNVSYKILCR